MSFKERYLRGDCSIDMVNDYVEMWHGEGEIKKTLSEFLGLSQEEYVCWMISSDEELARMLSRSLPNRDLPYCAGTRLEGAEGTAGAGSTDTALP